MELPSDISAMVSRFGTAEEAGMPQMFHQRRASESLRFQRSSITSKMLAQKQTIEGKEDIAKHSTLWVILILRDSSIARIKAIALFSAKTVGFALH